MGNIARSPGSTIHILLITLFSVSLVSCGSSSDDSNSTQSPAQSYIELVDPDTGPGEEYGKHLVELPNGNILVSNPMDSGNGPRSGAVHMFSSMTYELVASIYGNDEFDYLGSSGIYALSNNNFVIASPLDNEGGVLRVGSIRLIDGNTGLQIGSAITSPGSSDFINGIDIVELANQNFVVVEPTRDSGGLVDAGWVILVNGFTGVQIGTTIVGDDANDKVGSDGIIPLANGSFVVSSSNDDVGGVVDAGSVVLVDGSTGAQIGSTLFGETAFDLLGSGGVIELANGNYVVASPLDSVGGVAAAGSVVIIDGDSGTQVGVTFTGDDSSDQISRDGITPLANGNFVVASSWDNENGLSRTGSVSLIDGSTGTLVGTAIVGDNASDWMGFPGVTALPNGNYVIASRYDEVGGVNDAGSIILVDGSTGMQIGSSITGDNIGDGFGALKVAALNNGNFVCGSLFDDVAGIRDAGSVLLVDGNTGAQIGSSITGNNVSDQLGGIIRPLSNNNFVIASSGDDVGGVTDAGSVKLVSGLTGLQIGSDIAGDNTGDLLSFSDNGVTIFGNDRIAVISRRDDVDGITDAGSLKIIDGSTGAELETPIVGTNSDDFEDTTVLSLKSSDKLILSLIDMDNNGLFKSGFVAVVPID